MQKTVTRRTVLKAIGATLFAPMVTLRSEIDRERLLKAFCDDQPYRYDLDRPFGIGSLTYATDGRHMVRSELENRLEDGERRLPKDVEWIWKELWHPAEFRPFELPPIQSLVDAPHYPHSGICPLCNDRRLSYGEYYPTHPGEIPKGYDPDDNTYRDTSCPMCNGDDYNGPCHLRVAGQLMMYSRLKPIAALPNVMVAATRLNGPDARLCGPDAPILFVADGFEGMAMGLRED